jgi:signal transduction histidine kinase
LESILASIGDAVAVSDERGKFIHWNPAADRIMRMGPVDASPDEWPERFGLFEPDQVTPVPAERLPLVRAMRGEAVERVELFVRHDRAPEGVWLSVNARPWKDDNDKVRGGVSVFRDVTQEKAAQTQLMVSDRMASVGMLAAGVAHEINNPLAAVLANLDLAQRQLIDGGSAPGDIHELREMVDDARGAVERVRQIVRDLKVFSRHEDLKQGAVDISKVLDSSLRMAWNEIRHRARLAKDYYSDLGPVEGTESRLGQVFLNLIVNAAQAIPEGNADKNLIRVVTLPASDGRIAVEISDTGTGIAPEALLRLFTPFFTTKPAGVGTGLGLAICHRIVTGLGGDIEVESQPGRGTTFRVLLQAAKAAAVPEKLPPAPTVRPRRRGRVLVIDDDSMICAVIRRSLAPEHEVVVTLHATEALARIRRGDAFDVILCDLMMPQMTGMEFHAEIRSHDLEYADRIIFVTGGAFTRAARSFLDQVHNQRIEKPFDPQHLRALVNDRLK